MVDDAIYVSKNDNADVVNKKYKINEEGIICRKDEFFLYQSHTIEQYLNVFNYFRLKEENYDHKNYYNFGYLRFRIGHISYANLPLQYKNILGISGTLLNLNDSETSAFKGYGIKTITAIPSFFGENKLVFNPGEHVSILKNQSNWLSKIFESVSKCVNSNRAVLVFFETDIEMELFQGNYESCIDRLYTLTGNEDPEILEWRVNEAGVAQTVTLATKTMGRGIDYKSNDRSVEENGGVHVIQTFFSLNEKEEAQIKGRTARKNNHGSYELILNRARLLQMAYTGETFESLCVSRRVLENFKVNAIRKSITNAELKHNITMELFESLAKYTPEKRDEYLSKLNEHIAIY